MTGTSGGIGPGFLRLGHFVPVRSLRPRVVGELLSDMFLGPAFFRYFAGLDLAVFDATRVGGIPLTLEE